MSIGNRCFRDAFSSCEKPKHDRAARFRDQEVLGWTDVGVVTLPAHLRGSILSCQFCRVGRPTRIVIRYDYYIKIYRTLNQDRYAAPLQHSMRYPSGASVEGVEHIELLGSIFCNGNPDDCPFSFCEPVARQSGEIERSGFRTRRDCPRVKTQ